MRSRAFPGTQHLPRLAGILAACAVLASCGWSRVDDTSAPAPVAVIATVGQPYTLDGQGTLHTTVRSGADVVITGTSSHTGDAASGSPILAWTFQQTNPQPGSTLDLIKRTSDTYSFTAPQVTAETLLTLQLTVEDVHGRSATAQAQITVEPVRDADHFLTFLQTADATTVTAVTSTAIAADPSAAYNASVGFTVTVQKLVDYTDNTYVRHTDVPVGPAVQYTGGWSRQLGNGGANCSDPRNPSLPIAIPKLNLDDPIYASGQPTGQRLSDVMQASDIERDPLGKPDPTAPAGQQVIAPAVVKAQISITSTGSVTPQICVGSSAGGPSSGSPSAGELGTPVATTTVTADDLFAAANPAKNGGLFDTTVTAHTYYATIDPPTAASPWGTRTTLPDWLTQNHFDPTAVNYGADAHAVYTNDFDLGLGRDMYMKIGPCDGGAVDVAQFKGTSLTPAVLSTLTGLMGKCDVSAVVLNYVSLQAAVQHLNPVLAVAMEYSAYPSASSRYTKFYVFAPDQRSGVMQRITSADLDHRGQKPVPQSCVVCHGGTPPAASLQGAGLYPPGPSGIPGDVDAAFLPWDLSSFWYSDTDPGFSQKPQDAALKAAYTQAAQAGDLKLLNAGAYLTMPDPSRLHLARELIEGWYGAQAGQSTPAGLPGPYDGTFVPPAWQPTTAGNPVNSATLYTNVFAHSCRMCHTVQSGYDPAGAACQSTTHQCALGSYAQMVASIGARPGLVSQGHMPFARRTADRLWTDATGSGGALSAAGQELLTALAAAKPSIVTTAPGSPDVAVDALPRFTQHGLSDVLSWESLSTSSGGMPTEGALLATPSWQVCVDPGTGNCAAATERIPVINANSISGATFQVPAHTGSFLVELDAGGTPVGTPQRLTVPSTPPAVTQAALPDGVASGGALHLTPSVLGSPISGNGPLSAISWWISGLTNLTSPTPCVAPQICPVDSITGIELDTSVFQTSGTASFVVNIRDATGATASAAQTVTIQTVLTAAAATGYVAANQATALQTVQNSGNALDLVAGSKASASGDTIQVQVSCDYTQATGTGTWGTACALGNSPFGASGGMLSVLGNGVQYAPPLGLATAGPTGSTTSVVDGTQSDPSLHAFYRLVERKPDGTTVDAVTSKAATLDVQVRARTSWTQVVSQLRATSLSGGGNCVSCHSGNTTPIAFDVASDQLYCELVACPQKPADYPAGTASPLTPDIDAAEGTAAPYVRPSDVTAASPGSVLVAHPADLGTTLHTGADRCPPAGVALPYAPAGTVSASAVFQAGSSTSPLSVKTNAQATCDLVPLLQWIEDGAHPF